MGHGLLRRAGWVVLSGALLLGAGGAAWGQDTTPPTAPSGLTATTVGAGRIKLTWTGSTDNVTPPGSIWYRILVAETAEDLNLPNPDSFWVQGGVNAQGVRTHPLTQTYGGDDAVLRPLEPGTTYFIRVEARDAAWNPSASNDASATTLLVKRLTGVSVEEAGYVRDVLHRNWFRSRNAGVSGKPLLRAGYSFQTEEVSGSDWIVKGFLTAHFELQGLLTAADQCCVSRGASATLSVSYDAALGRLTAEIWPVDTSEANYAGKAKQVTGFSRIHDRDSSGNVFGHSVTSFTQETTITASVIAKGLPYYVLPYLEIARRTDTGSVSLSMGHRWYSEVELTDQVTGVEQTDVKMTWKKKKRSLFHSSTKTKTLEQMDLEPFQTSLTTKSAGSGLWAVLNVDTSRQRMDLANPGKIFPDWLPMHATLRADLKWSVTVDNSSLKLVLDDHGTTDGPALEGSVRDVFASSCMPILGCRTWVRYYAFGGEGLHVTRSEVLKNHHEAVGRTGTPWLLAWTATGPLATLLGPTPPTNMRWSLVVLFNNMRIITFRWNASTDRDGGTPPDRLTYCLFVRGQSREFACAQHQGELRRDFIIHDVPNPAWISVRAKDGESFWSDSSNEVYVNP